MRLLGAQVSKKRYHRPNDQQRVFSPPGYAGEVFSRRSNRPETKVPIVYACLQRVAGQLGMMKRDVISDYTNRPAKKPMWVEEPNAYMTGGEMIHSLVSSLLLYGNAFVFPARDPGDASRILGLAIADPSYVSYRTMADGTAAWIFNGIEWPGEMVHMKYLSLPQRLWGLGPMTSMERLNQVSDSTLDYSLAFVDSGGAYQIVLSYPDVNTPPEVLQDAAYQIMSKHSGSNNAFVPLVVSGGARVENINQSNVDAQYLDLSNMTDARICAQGFGLDPEEMGLSTGNESMTYKNEPGRWWRTWQYALRPLAYVIEEGLSGLLPEGQRFDLNQREFLLGGPHDRVNAVASLAQINYSLAEAEEPPLLTREEMREFLGYY